MAAIAFDTLKFTKRLREAGVSEKQAEAEAEVLVDIFAFSTEQLASKQDIKDLEVALTQDIKSVEVNLKNVEANLTQDIESLKKEFKSDILLLEQRMVIKLGAMLVVTIGIVTTLMKIL